MQQSVPKLPQAPASLVRVPEPERVLLRLDVGAGAKVDLPVAGNIQVVCVDDVRPRVEGGRGADARGEDLDASGGALQLEEALMWGVGGLVCWWARALAA